MSPHPKRLPRCKVCEWELTPNGTGWVCPRIGSCGEHYDEKLNLIINKKKIYMIDLDGTVCEDVKNEEGVDVMRDTPVLEDAVTYINSLYDEGNYVCFFSARTDEFKDVTEEWLKRHGVKYHQLILNKPRKLGEYVEYHYIDNSHVRATTYLGKFTDFIKKKKEVEVFE